MFDGDPLKSGIGNHHAVQTNQSEQPAMKLVSAAFVMAVEKNYFGADLLFFPSLKVFSPGEADEMFLETTPRLGANALLFGPNRDPSVFPHSLEDRGSREKTVPI